MTSTCGLQALNIISKSAVTVNQLQEDSPEGLKLSELARKVNSLYSLVGGYTATDREDISTDDEIINWTFSDVAGELCSALWNLSSGFYKTSASCLRGALEMGAVSLYFQMRENDDPGAGYNQEFVNWDSGVKGTPSWGTTKSKIKASKNVFDFEIANGYNPIEEAYDHFKFLCSFTHSRAYSPEDRKGTNFMNMNGNLGSFNKAEFQRISEAMDKTIAMIASMWIISYPHILEVWNSCDGDDATFCKLEEIFSCKSSFEVLNFSLGKL